LIERQFKQNLTGLSLNGNHYLEGRNITSNFLQFNQILNLSIEYKILKKKKKHKTFQVTTYNINHITNSMSLPAVTLGITPAR
jgi:hypothetical protein